MLLLRAALVALYICLDLQVMALQGVLRVLEEADRDSRRDVDGAPTEARAYSQVPDVPEHLRRQPEEGDR